MQVINQHTTKNAVVYNADCVELCAQLPDESIDYSIFSPPFASLYTYSDSPRDMGNNATYEEFLIHFKFLSDELFRATKTGRNLSFHCAQIPLMKERDGRIGLRDFRGDLIRVFQSSGFTFHAEVTIWKDPVVEMTRTKALGLLHKQLKKDSVRSRMGLPDYVITMRKDGDNDSPVTHKADDFPVSRWQKVASPVWMDIDQGNTLNYTAARDKDDERHICPLQLGVIERCLELNSNRGDVILSPFAGIGSEGYMAIKMRRKFIGVELKESYFRLQCKNINDAEESLNAATLFDIHSLQMA